MDDKTIRLECIKLCNRSDWEPNFIIARATEFEKYIIQSVTDKQEVVEKRPPGRPKK